MSTWTAPASAEVRCCMGWPLGIEWQCWGETKPDSLWCDTCASAELGQKTPCDCPGCTLPYPSQEAL